jgi:hypothetical protein
MQDFTNAAASLVGTDQLNAFMADCVALEHVRVFRRLLVVRCGIVALAIAVGGLMLGLLHSFAYWFSVGIFVLAPVGTWIVEIRRQRSLSRKLHHLSAGATDVVVPPSS